MTNSIIYRSFSDQSIDNSGKTTDIRDLRFFVQKRVHLHIAILNAHKNSGGCEKNEHRNLEP